MDLDNVRQVVVARTRQDLAVLADDTAVLAGGTWLYSEPQDRLVQLVDITEMGWPALTVTDFGLEIAATCTLAELADARFGARWPATALFEQACRALLASHKICQVATVGGNVCLALPVGAVLAALTALDGAVLIWGPDGGERTVSLARFVVGPGHTVLKAGEVVRAVTIPDQTLRSRTALRKAALAPLGRSGALLIGCRAPGGSFTLTISAATTRPVLYRFPDVPEDDDVAAAVDDIEHALWYDDPHGQPDWRRHVSKVLAREVAAELRHTPVGS